MVYNGMYNVCIVSVTITYVVWFLLYPELQHHIPSDRDVMVRMAFAECIAELANTAHRYVTYLSSA